MSNYVQPPYWALVAPYFESVSIYDGPGACLTALGGIPEPSQALLTTHWTQSEIRNGGFIQYFLNPTAVLAPEALTGFEALEMPRTADVLRQAVSKFGLTYPREADVRHSVLMAKFPDFDFEEEVDLDSPYPFDDIEDRMFDLLDSENGGFENAAAIYTAKFAK